MVRGLFIGLVFFFAFVSSLAAEPRGQMLNGDGECLVYEYQEGEIVSLKVAPYANLHIQMPDGVYLVNIGGGRLWHAQYSKQRPLPHVWVKSKNSDLYEAQTTSMTVLDTNLKPYHFVLNRLKNPGYTCAKIILPETADMLNRLENWRSPESLAFEEQAARMQAAEMNMNKRVEAIKEHAADQIKTERARLFTQYTWVEDGERVGAGDKPLIRSVMDDGIFTYITLNDSASGLLSVYGFYGDKEHQVQAQYDPQLMQYTLTGVYSAIRLRYDNFVVDIKRNEQE